MNVDGENIDIQNLILEILEGTGSFADEMKSKISSVVTTMSNDIRDKLSSVKIPEREISISDIMGMTEDESSEQAKKFKSIQDKIIKKTDTISNSKPLNKKKDDVSLSDLFGMSDNDIKEAERKFKRQQESILEKMSKMSFGKTDIINPVDRPSSTRTDIKEPVTPKEKTGRGLSGDSVVIGFSRLDRTLKNSFLPSLKSFSQMISGGSVMSGPKKEGGHTFRNDLDEFIINDFGVKARNFFYDLFGDAPDGRRRGSRNKQQGGKGGDAADDDFWDTVIGVASGSLIAAAVKSIIKTLAKKTLVGAGVALKGIVMNPATWIAAGLIMAGLNGVEGFLKAEDGEWDVREFSGAIGAFIGGTGSGWVGALQNALPWASVGMGLGIPFGIPGMIAGALIGGALGAVAGWLGGEQIAGWIDKIADELIFPTTILNEAQKRQIAGGQAARLLRSDEAEKEFSVSTMNHDDLLDLNKKLQEQIYNQYADISTVFNDIPQVMKMLGYGPDITHSPSSNILDNFSKLKKMGIDTDTLSSALQGDEIPTNIGLNADQIEIIKQIRGQMKESADQAGITIDQMQDSLIYTSNNINRLFKEIEVFAKNAKDWAARIPFADLPQTKQYDFDALEGVADYSDVDMSLGRRWFVHTLGKIHMIKRRRVLKEAEWMQKNGKEIEFDNPEDRDIWRGIIQDYERHNAPHVEWQRQPEESETVPLANGGIVNRPTLAMIGEENKPEAVIPLDKDKDALGLHMQFADMKKTFKEMVAGINNLIAVNEMTHKELQRGASGPAMPLKMPTDVTSSKPRYTGADALRERAFSRIYGVT